MTTTGCSGEELLEQAIGYALGRMGAVTPMSLHRSTPCADWNLGRLLGHLAASLTTLTTLLSGRPDGATTAEPIIAVGTSAALALDAVAHANRDRVLMFEGLPMATSTVTCAGALEVAIHGWDITRACGSVEPIPARLAERLLPLAPILVAATDRAGLFAAPVGTRADATAADRLIAFVGRSPGTTSLDLDRGGLAPLTRLRGTVDQAL
jgi:uncharacterized protein (TIGR03086 family)